MDGLDNNPKFQAVCCVKYKHSIDKFNAKVTAIISNLEKNDGSK